MINVDRYANVKSGLAGAGSGAAPAPEPVTPPAPVVPGAPVMGVATAAAGQATVIFTPPASDGGSPITGYTVTSSPPGGIDSNAGTTALVHVVNGLTNGTAYTFTAVATNAVGAGPASAASNSVTPAVPALFAVTSDIFVAYNGYEKAMPNEPMRVQGVLKNDSLGPIFVSENNDLNYQKNRPPANSATVAVTVPPGQEYVTDTGRMVYAKSYGGTSTAATFAAGVATVTMAAHGFVAGQLINVAGAVPVEYNTAIFPATVTVASVIDPDHFTYVPQLTPAGAATTQLVVQAVSILRVERKVTA